MFCGTSLKSICEQSYPIKLYARSPWHCNFFSIVSVAVGIFAVNSTECGAYISESNTTTATFILKWREKRNILFLKLKIINKVGSNGWNGELPSMVKLYYILHPKIVCVRWNLAKYWSVLHSNSVQRILINVQFTYNCNFPLNIFI